MSPSATMPSLPGEKQYVVPRWHDVDELRKLDQAGALVFYYFTRARKWYGWQQPRTCKTGDPECPADGAFLVAQAIEDANDFPSTTPPTTDVVVGRIYALDDGSDATYDRCRKVTGKGASTECYLIIKARTGLEVMAYLGIPDPRTNDPYTLTLEPVMDGAAQRQFKFCGGTHQSAPEADFRPCVRHTNEQQLRDMKDEHGKRLWDPKTSPFWIACNEGCCS